MFTATLTVGAMLASAVSGHMLLAHPLPFAQSVATNFPLEADGSNFPCKVPHGTVLQADGVSNTFALGESQKLSFIGQAVHGGGSCQVSITYDENPNPNSVWKVIRSIEGGCPAQNQAGNMGGNAQAADPFEYNFTVPTNIPTGKVTLAWTWFNKIGNREMYMGCAPVTLTGTSGSKENYDSLPDMFVANVGNGCGTVDSSDLLFPNPGNDVVSLNGATSAFSTPTGNCQAAGAKPSVGNGPASASSAVPTVSSLTPYKSAAPSGSGIPGGVFVTLSGSSAPVGTGGVTFNTITTGAVASKSPASLPTISSAPAVPTGPSPSGTASSSGSGTQHQPGSPCSDNGAWNCMGSTFQRCASGVWSVVQNVAAGTKCSETDGAMKIAAGKKNKKVRAAVPFRA